MAAAAAAAAQWGVWLGNRSAFIQIGLWVALNDVFIGRYPNNDGTFVRISTGCRGGGVAGPASGAIRWARPGPPPRVTLSPSIRG